MVRAKDICADDSLTPEEKWEKIYGTESIGNLPTFKSNNHEGRSYAPCPYSTQSPELRVRHMLNLTMSGTLPTRVNHVDENGREYFMRMDYKNDWGMVCTFSGCVFLLDEGEDYFYK